MTDYTLFGASHANGTTLTKVQVEAGSGDAEDTFSITGASLAALAGDPEFTTAIADADISVFVRHINGVESALYSENVGAITIASGAFTPADLLPIAGAWSEPADLSTLAANDDGTGSVAVGDVVEYVQDKFGNGNHSTGSGNGPVLRQTGGGLYYLEANGGNTNMTLPLGVSSTPFMSLAVESTGGATEEQHLFRDFGSTDFLLRYNGANSLLQFYLKDGGGTLRLVSHSTGSAYAPEVITAYFDGSNMILRRNGAQVGSLAMTGVTTDGDTQIREMNHNNNASALNGKWFGKVWLETVPSASEIDDIEAYLADLGGITL